MLFFRFTDVKQDNYKIRSLSWSIFNMLKTTALSSGKFREQKLPAQKQKKATILFNPENFLVKRYPSFFGQNIILRPYYDLFLFDMAQNYELLAYGRFTPSESNFIYKHLDPYGCINYRLNTDCIDLNRNFKDLIVIETDKNQWNGKYQDNILRIERWDGIDDDKLFLLEQFLNNILYIDRGKWLETIKSYRNVPFFQIYDQVQRRIFRSKYFFFSDYNIFKEKLKKEKLHELKKAKVVMDEEIEKNKILRDYIKPFIGLVRQILL